MHKGYRCLWVTTAAAAANELIETEMMPPLEQGSVACRHGGEPRAFLHVRRLLPAPVTDSYCPRSMWIEVSRHGIQLTPSTGQRARMMRWGGSGIPGQRRRGVTWHRNDQQGRVARIQTRTQTHTRTHTHTYTDTPAGSTAVLGSHRSITAAGSPHPHACPHIGRDGALLRIQHGKPSSRIGPWPPCPVVAHARRPGQCLHGKLPPVL